MATIRKRGKSYQIRVSCGYKSSGEQIIKTMTYKPPSGMTARQVSKEVQRQAVLFEEKCKRGAVLDGSIKLSDFAQKWFQDYAEMQLKAKTVARYRELMRRIDAYLGHIRLDRIMPHHLLEFYKALEEKEVRGDIKYAAQKDIRQKLKDLNITQAHLAKLSGVSAKTVQTCVSGRNISKQSAEKISKAIGETDLFRAVGKNLTLSAKTVQYYHRLISSMLSTAVEWQLIPYNPCTRVKPPKAPQTEASFLDEVQAAEMIRLLKSEPPLYQTIIMLFLYSGMRRGELCGLNWNDIDFEHNLVNISKSSLYLPKLGIYEDTTKNKNSQRVVRIPPEMTALLKEHQREQIKRKLCVGHLWHDSGKVFTSDTGKPIHPDTITRWFRNFVRKNNLPDVHVHSLRHTNATLLIAAGTNIRTVSGRLGHSATSTTSNIYAHAIKSADELAAKTLSDILKPLENNESAK